MKLFKALGSLFSGKDPVTAIFDGIDKISTSKEEKEALRIEAIKLSLEERKQSFTDKENARSLYAKDSSLQKLFGIVFLCSYIGLTGWLVYLIAEGSITKITQFETGLLGTIWGAMSAKVNTITDFLFGGSQGEKDYKHMKNNERPLSNN